MGTGAVGETRRVVGAQPRGGRAPAARAQAIEGPAIKGPAIEAQAIEAQAVPPRIQLTARGAVVGLFVACFVTIVLADWTGWSALADLAFVGGGTAAARYTKPGALLALVVSPPMIFLAACVCAELLTASGTLATVTGVFVTLGTSAPWLFVGTALILAVALCRGLPAEIAGLIAGVRGVAR